jgi:hypothetical protein
MAALIGAGMLDRYPQLRLTALECGHGWLAFWASRLDELAEMSRHALPPLKQRPSEYIRGPQYFQSIQIHEGEQSLRHFAYLERPEGLDMADQDALAAVEKSAPLPRAAEDEIGAHLQDFETIGELYRSIEQGLDRLAARLGDARWFVGPAEAQATGAHFWGFDDLTPVIDLASARAAIDTIVEQGEGARGEWRNAHFGRLVTILDEYLELREADPDFEPARPVLAAAVRGREDGVDVPLITDAFASRATDLLNAVYEVILQLLARYFAHTDESEDQLRVLAQVAMLLMKNAIKPLGGLVTRLPVGFEHLGSTVGPTFELFYPIDYLLPHREAAWIVLEERLRDLAELGVRCRDVCSPLHMPVLDQVTAALSAQADELAAAR